MHLITFNCSLCVSTQPVPGF